jgi:hypothetical protein
MYATAKITELLGFVGEVLCVGGSCHRRFAIFCCSVVPYLRTVYFLRGDGVDRRDDYSITRSACEFYELSSSRPQPTSLRTVPGTVD